MGLKALLDAAAAATAAKDRIQALKNEKDRLQLRLDSVNAELASARADSDAALAIIKAEAPGVVSP